jgi:DNA-binding phage protein
MKKIVFTFGRMNPPTVGHQKLVDKVKSVAKAQKADARVYLSHSQNNKKDPLDYDTKINLAKKAFGSTVTKSRARTIIDVMKELTAQKYTDVVLVVGSDRIKEFKTLLDKYNGKDYNFESIKYQSAGQRDPDAEGVSGMSASKMRAAAKEGDLKAFKSGLPKPLQSSAQKIYDMLRDIMETEELDEAVMTLQQRMKRARTMKRIAKKLAMKRKIRKKRFADASRLLQRARKAAKNILRKKLAGSRGENYKQLSFSGKMSVDKLVDKRSGVIDKLAKRLLPKVRKAEMARVKAARSGPKNEEYDWLENEDLVFELYESDAEEFMTELLDEARQDSDIKDREGTQPAKYHSGLKKSTKTARDRAFKRGAEKDPSDPSAYPKSHPGDSTAKTKMSKHTKKYHQMFGEKVEEEDLTENAKAALMKKADKSGISYGILKKVYDRGLAAWRTGHRPGANQQQWGFARVNSFITKGKGTWGKADADLAAKVRGSKSKSEDCWDGYHQQGMKKKGDKVVPNCVKEAVSPAQQAAIAISKKKKFKEMMSKSGAGEFGSTELANKYKKDTPGQVTEDCDCDYSDVVITEAEYQGRSVKLNDPFRLPSGNKKKFGVYVKNSKGNVVVVKFGDPNMEIKRDDPARRKSFRARHDCANKTDKTTPGYWSCYQWRASAKVDN